MSIGIGGWLLRGLTVAGSVLTCVLTVVVLAKPAASPLPAFCPVPTASPIAVVPRDPDMEPVRMEHVVDADYYVDRLRSLRAACKAWGGRDVTPLAVEEGVFVECWSPGSTEFFWSRWVVFHGQVSGVPPPGRADLPQPRKHKP